MAYFGGAVKYYIADFVHNWAGGGGGHSGRGGQMIENAKLKIKPKKLRPIAQNSGHVARRFEVSTEIL